MKMWLAVLLIASSPFLVVSALAQPESIKCQSAELRSVEVDHEYDKAVISRVAKSISLGRADATATQGHPDRTIIVFGPVLGSMDAGEVQTKMACTAHGLTITATLTRSSYFNGAAAKNILWVPKISVTLIPRKKDLDFAMIWNMRLSDGSVVHQTQTPSLDIQQYPFKLKDFVTW